MPLSLDETIKCIDEELKSNSLNFTEEEKLTLETCFNTICSDIKILQDELEPIENLKNRDNIIITNLINKTIYVLNEHFLNRSLSQERVTFIKCMLEFIFNWNNNLLNNKMISSSCSVLYQSLDLIGHITKTIEVLQKTISIYQDLKTWLPPAFDISKIYLDELLKKE